MLTRIRKAQQEREGGFTLIELLVVVIIIGVLAAIAIPVFINQRLKAYDSASKAELRNIAVAQESAATESATGAYTNNATTLASSGYRASSEYGTTTAAATAGSPPTVTTTGIKIDVDTNGTAWCAMVIHPKNSKAVWAMSNSSGGPVSGKVCNAGALS